MATYVKGANQYSVDIKPFTPDYKFLSAVLETRQDKYDTNFKATNDLYNKVVYADLSREDTKERRDQYAEQIGPQIEKISGMDLSLAQNVNQAKSVFAPFYEDDLTVKDIVYTANYRDEMKHANRLKNAANEKLNERYSDIGVQGLNYRMEDFINASPEEALNMGVPKYVDNVNLFKTATELLEEMDPNLSMEMDRFGTDANGDPITDFIIREKNGRLIQGQALQTLQSALLNDPRVQRFYAERSFVQSRDFAQQAMADGAYSSIKDAQNAWATQTIANINALNNQRETEESDKLNQLESANIRWSNYKQNNGIVEGSQLDDAITENLSAAEATRIALDRIKGVQTIGANEPNTTDGLLNQAYAMLMNYNIMGDLNRAALSYSQRDQKFLIRENEHALKQKQFEYDMAKIRANATNAMNIELLKQQGKDRNTILDKGYRVGDDGQLIRLPWAEGVDPNNPLAALLQGNNTTFGSAGTVDVPVDEDGDADMNVDMILRTQEQFIEKDNALANKQVNNIIDMLTVLYPTGTTAEGEEMGDGTWTIEVPNATGGVDKVTGDIDGLRQILLEPTITGEGKDARVVGYNNRELINSVFNQVSDEFKNTRAVTMSNPEVTLSKDRRNQYNDIYNQISGINGTETQMKGLQLFTQNVYDNYYQTYEAVKGNAMTPQADQGNNVKLLYDSGFPDIINPETKLPYSSTEYLQLVVDGVNNKTITNPDLYGNDTGTDNTNYLKDEVIYETYMGKSGEGPNIEKVRTVRTGRKVVDMAAITEEANLFYNKMYENLNAALTGATGDFKSGDLDSEIYGISGKFSDVVSNPSYERMFNPTVPNPLAEQEVAQMLIQIEDLENKGLPYGILSGDINIIEDPAQLANVKEPLAVKVFEMWKKDAAVWMSGKTPAVSTGIKAPAAKIVYMPAFGRAQDGEKTLGAYKVVFSADWLASKKAGTNTATGNVEFGSLNSDEILQLQGRVDDDNAETSGQAGITIMFDQSVDLNNKSAINTYYSYVETDIAASGTNYHTYTMPNDNGINPTGEFRVTKLGPNNYQIYSKVYTYQPGGQYTLEENTVKADMSNGLRGLDQAVSNYYKVLENKRNQNQLAREKDQATNGKK